MKRLLTATFLSTVLLFNSVAFAADKVNTADITGDWYGGLKTAGIADNTASYNGTTTNGTVDIESVKTLGEHCIIVTLGSYFPDFNVADIKLQAYNSDWYSLSPKLENRITYDKYAVTTNSEGKTVVIFYIDQNINNNVLEDDYEVKELTDAEKTDAITVADNEITWQLDNGGWYKAYDLHKTRAWDGKEKKNVDAKGSTGWSAADGTPCGTIDNDATYSEMEDIALAYSINPDEKYKKSFEKGLDFIKLLQYPTGGLAQVYPSRGKDSYSDYVTLNDDAMANVLIMLEEVKEKRFPYNTGIVDEKYYSEIENIISDATDYLLKAQIVSNGILSAWCAQHDPVTYEPRPARAYELESISGSESIGVIKFLMHQHDNPEAVKAAEAAIDWFDNHKLENTKFDKNTAPYFFEKAGSTIWYRFYEIDTDKGFFSDRDGGKYFDISQISEERRTGYAWTGTWPQKIISTYQKYGYYPNRIVVSVSGTNSKDVNGKTLTSAFSISPTEDNIADSLPDAVDEIIYGDADNNGILEANDAAYLLEYTLDGSFYNADEEWIKKCDVDGEAGLTANDASYILQKTLDKSFNFNVK